MELRNKYATFLLSYHPGMVRDLPIVSPFATSLAAQNARPLYSTDALFKAFETDPFLSAKLFGVANSIFFNQNHQGVFTVREALERVGIDYAMNLLRHAPYFSGTDPRDVREYWRHCMAVAGVAKELAAIATNVKQERDTVFLLAMIHDIGYLVEMDYDPSSLRSVATHLRSGEDEGAAVSHTKLGESLATFWSLPECARHAIRWHHSPAACAAADGKVVCALIYVAEHVVSACALGGTIDVEACRESLAIAGLREDDLARVRASAAKCVSDAV